MKKCKLWKHEHDIHVFIQICICKQQPVTITYFKFKNITIEINLILGFHRALLQSITFISRLNALDYTKLRG